MPTMKSTSVAKKSNGKNTKPKKVATFVVKKTIKALQVSGEIIIFVLSSPIKGLADASMYS